MKSGAIIVVGLALLVIVGLLAAGLAVTGQRSGSSSGAVTGEVLAGTPAQPPDDGSAAIVYNTYRTNAGLRVLGMQVRQPDYAAAVGFVPPAGCSSAAGSTLLARGACAAVPAAGDVTGDGTTRSGKPIVIVQVPISNGCFEVLQPGDAWPSTHPACHGR